MVLGRNRDKEKSKLEWPMGLMVRSASYVIFLRFRTRIATYIGWGPYRVADILVWIHVCLEEIPLSDIVKCSVDLGKIPLYFDLSRSSHVDKNSFFCRLS